MDMSFALQVEALHYLRQNHGSLSAGVLKLPQQVDEKVAWRKLAALNISIDTLTEKQKKYLNSWQ